MHPGYSYKWVWLWNWTRDYIKGSLCNIYGCYFDVADASSIFNALYKYLFIYSETPWLLSMINIKIFLFIDIK